MLVMKRRRNEGVLITTPGGETVRVIVASYEYHAGNLSGVRLGIDAPRSFKIDRDEVAMAKAVAAAACPLPTDH